MAPEIVIAGASGYIGRAAIPVLIQKFPGCHITALSRSRPESPRPNVDWRACDLFSLRSLEEALPKQVDIALYLVHSMGPTAHLDQGSFSDYDVILADNFARALRNTGLKQIIYLGGLIPQSGSLSLHLKSRLEVEETFSSHQLPMTVFRAGLILGQWGSSSQILTKLVRRLPVMVCPSWTQTLTSPIKLSVVLEAITEAALAPHTIGKVYDLAGCQPITYLEIMRQTARKLGKRRVFFKFPLFTPTLSRLWVSLITNTPKALVYPLIQSLQHPMVARADHLWPGCKSDQTYSAMLQGVDLSAPKKNRPLFRFRPPGENVRSVQRLPLPQGKDAQWVREQYVTWLSGFLRPFLRVRTNSQGIAFSMPFYRPVLMELRNSPERSTPDRQLLYLVGGKLVKAPGRSRLEFRVVLKGAYVLAAIHEYQPALPWFLYKWTQARLHLLVMRAFARHLAHYGA